MSDNEAARVRAILKELVEAMAGISAIDPCAPDAAKKRLRAAWAVAAYEVDGSAGITREEVR